MTLSAGTKLGPYEILAAIGAGGMGEVYRARDTRLGREVAIKALPSTFSTDPERLQRFEQEARAAAALNHPNILAVYDIGQHPSTSSTGSGQAGSGQAVPYIVSELLDGDTLRERLRAGALPLRKAIDYATQIAYGLAAAHGKAIVHRDLKPENLFVTSDGRAKILDFGLAKLTQPAMAGGAEGPDYTPTVTPTMPPNTVPGLLLGTIGYMSPEQVRGLPADHRSDIFAFGAVLYEMLSGRRAFRGETTPDTMSAILKEDPPELPNVERHLPPALERIIERCLEKNPGARFQSTDDLAFALESLSTHSDAAADSAAIVAGSRGRRDATLLAWKVATAAAFVVAGGLLPLVIRHVREAPPDEIAARFALLPPEHVRFQLDRYSVSPDGRHIAFVGARAAETSIWVRALDSLTARQLPDTSGASWPFWSPDSRSIGFGAGQKLKTVEVASGTSRTVSDLTFTPESGAWNRDGVIIFSEHGHGLFRVRAMGGTPDTLTTPDPNQHDVEHFGPDFLPDGRHFLYHARSRSPERSGVFVGSLDGGEPKRLLDSETAASYAPPDYLLFGRGRAVLAQRFDVTRLTISGDPVTVPLTLVATFMGHATAGFSVSRNGVLVYRSDAAAETTQMAWFDRAGRQLGTIGEPGPYRTFDLSHDGSRIVVARDDDQTHAVNLSIVDLGRNTTMHATLGTVNDTDPRWSPDGREIMFGSTRSPNRSPFRMPVSGGTPSQVLFPSDAAVVALDDWSRDGRYVLYHDSGAPDLWAVPLDGDRKPVLAARMLSGMVDQARFAPDGRWVAFNANESGRFEVYVVPFPSTGDKWQISTAGGVQPMWRADGNELFYLTLDGTMTAVDVKGARTFSVGELHVLFPAPLDVVNSQTEQYAVTGDGRRFLVEAPLPGAQPEPLNVLLNWTAALKK